MWVWPILLSPYKLFCVFVLQISGCLLRGVLCHLSKHDVCEVYTRLAGYNTTSWLRENRSGKEVEDVSWISWVGGERYGSDESTGSDMRDVEVMNQLGRRWEMWKWWFSWVKGETCKNYESSGSEWWINWVRGGRYGCDESTGSKVKHVKTTSQVGQNGE